jgi:hypothetical protein
MFLESKLQSEGVSQYLDRVRQALVDLPEEKQEILLAAARARIELELELAETGPGDSPSRDALVARLGDPTSFAQSLRTQLPAERAKRETTDALTGCRVCHKDVSREAVSCPHCGAPRPAQVNWDGTGYEWKSERTLFGLPLVHVAVGRNAKGKLRVAKGIIAIGQFGIGAITIAQFGVGAIFGLGQFVVAPLAIGQFALGLAALGQFGIGLLYGFGMFATGLKAIGMNTIGNWFSKP